ncbi:MAG: hypothetical protein JWO38_5503 [Gemmataceae bacterium]|nr:hypothetical protein [Gemmataceae bacterium]
MYRRVVSLVLLPGLLLTQSAVFGHSHGGNQPAGHGIRLHIHTNPAPARHDLGHHHGPGGHHHHHDADDEPEPAQPEPMSGHDDDAVYVADEVIVARPVQTGDDGTRDLVWLLPSPGVSADRWTTLSEREGRWTHPPPRITTADCPLYLRHLSLLI